MQLGAKLALSKSERSIRNLNSYYHSILIIKESTKTVVVDDFLQSLIQRGQDSIEEAQY